MDIRNFFQTSSSAPANATLRMHGHDPGAERLQAGPVTFRGKIAAALRSVLHLTSDSERRATQAFVAAIGQDYGSSGLEMLRRLNISSNKPLQVRQVRELAQNLEVNRASEELRPFRTLGQSHIVDQANDIWRWDRFTDLRRVISHSLADLSTEARAIVEAGRAAGQPGAPTRPELAFFAAVVDADADRLWNLPGVRQEFERRLDITGTLPDLPTPVRDHIVRRSTEPDDASVAAATVLADMFRDRRDALAAAGIRARGY